MFSPADLHVVAVYANPVQWKARVVLHKNFEDFMIAAGVSLTTVECAYGETPFVLEDRPGVNRVRVRSKTTVWNKECLINIGVSRLPDSWKYLMWCDADIMFRSPTWVTDTIHALQHYDVIQPWEDCYDLGPNGEHVQGHKSFLSQWWKGEPVVPTGPKFWKFSGGPYEYPHCGYAWAITRPALAHVGGLLEIGAMGAGDHHMALSLVGRGETSLPGWETPSYKTHVLRWQARAVQHINYNLGYIGGTIEHYWHGKKADRKYLERWEMIKKWAFDPDTDLKRNTYGVLELACNKPGLQHDLQVYFRQRNEDSNTL